MKFRLATIAYVFALLAAGMAAFGAVCGMILGGLVLAGWCDVVAGRHRLRVLAILGALGLTTLVLLPPFIADASNAARRNDCLSNMKQIMLGLHNYEDVHGAFPPAFIADADGKPMHSWRVLILPFMEQRELYDQYDFDEPWDGPHNRKLWDQMPYFYSCKGCERCRKIGGEPFGELPKNASNYVAVGGAEAAWPGATGRKLTELADGTSNTLMILEYSGASQPWTAPVDLPFDEAVDVLTGDDSQGHLTIDESLVTATFTRDCRIAGFGDGHGSMLPNGLTEEYARALMTIAGGETVGDDREPLTRSDVVARIATVIRYERVYALLAFLGLALWPGVRMWRSGRRRPRFEEPRANGAGR